VERQTTDEVEHFHALDKQFTVVIETKKEKTRNQSKDRI